MIIELILAAELAKPYDIVIDYFKPIGEQIEHCSWPRCYKLKADANYFSLN